VRARACVCMCLYMYRTGSVSITPSRKAVHHELSYYALKCSNLLANFPSRMMHHLLVASGDESCSSWWQADRQW
jgi:hypothetical protein